MADDLYQVLDTRIIDSVIAQRGHWMESYSEIEHAYKEAVDSLLENWKGRGADAFRQDAKAVQRNISGVYDILRTMCDTLTDCRELFSKRDGSLGKYNQGETP